MTQTLGGNVLLCRYSVQSLLLIIIDTKSWNNKWNCHESQQWKKKVWNQPRRNWKWQTCQFKSIFPWKSWGTMCFDVVKCKAKVFWERRKNRTLLLCPLFTNSTYFKRIIHTSIFWTNLLSLILLVIYKNEKSYEKQKSNFTHSLLLFALDFCNGWMRPGPSICLWVCNKECFKCTTFKDLCCTHLTNTDNYIQSWF